VGLLVGYFVKGWIDTARFDRALDNLLDVGERGKEAARAFDDLYEELSKSPSKRPNPLKRVK
jgi:hypothetical protein